MSKRNHIFCFIAVLLLVECVFAANETMSMNAELYLRQALQVVERHSMFRTRTNWKKITEEVFAMAKEAKTAKDTYPAIRKIFILSKDEFSRLYDKDTYEKNYKQAEVAPSGELLQENIAYLHLPAQTNQGRESRAEYIELAQKTMCILANKNPCAWIIDLRRNEHSDLWSLFGALQPLLKQGALGSEMVAGQSLKRWTYQENGFYVGNQLELEQNAACHPEQSQIVVLMDGRTSDAAEALIAYLQSTNKKIVTIGRETQGNEILTKLFPLSDGAVIQMATSKFLSPTGRFRDGPIVPDQAVAKGDDSLKRAEAYLSKQGYCQKLLA